MLRLTCSQAGISIKLEVLQGRQPPEFRRDVSCLVVGEDKKNRHEEGDRGGGQIGGGSDVRTHQILVRDPHTPSKANPGTPSKAHGNNGESRERGGGASDSPGRSGRRSRARVDREGHTYPQEEQ